MNIVSAFADDVMVGLIVIDGRAIDALILAVVCKAHASGVGLAPVGVLSASFE